MCHCWRVSLKKSIHYQIGKSRVEADRQVIRSQVQGSGQGQLCLKLIFPWQPERDLCSYVITTVGFIVICQILLLHKTWGNYNKFDSQNTTMRVYKHGLKDIKCCVQRHIAPRAICYNPSLVRDKPLGAPTTTSPVPGSARWLITLEAYASGSVFFCVCVFRLLCCLFGLGLWLWRFFKY